MIERVRNNTRILFKESFIPVMLVMAALAFLLIYVNFQATTEANRILTIEIRSNDGQSDNDEDTDDIVFSFSRSENNLPALVEAEQAIKNRNWQRAEDIYQQQLREQATSQSYNDLGVLFYLRMDYQKALYYLKLAAATEPVFIESLVNLGLTYTRLTMYDEALDVYQQTLTQVPHHFLAQLNRGVVLLLQENARAAIDELKTAVSLAGGGRKAKALYNLGLAYRGIEDMDAARKAFHESIRLYPGYIKPRFALASLEPDTEEGRLRAMKVYETVLDLVPNYPPAYFHMAQLHNAAGNRESAQQAYLKAIQNNPNYSKARYNLALTYLDEHRWSDARALFDQLIADNSNDPLIHFQLGRAAFGEKDYPTALAEYDKALALKNGGYPKALLNKGRVLSASMRTDEAIASYKEAIQLDDNYAQAWYNLGLAYLRKRDLTQSISSLQRAIEIRPDYAIAWFNLGLVYAQQDNIDAAVKSYEKAIAKKPNYLRAKLNLAVLKSKQGFNTQAIRLYKEVLDLDVQYASAWLNMGIAYSKVDQYEQAEPALLKAIELEPDNTKAKRQLARNYQRVKRFEEAIALLRDAVDRNENDYKLRLELGKTLMMAEMPAQARTELEKARKLAPDEAAFNKAMEGIQQ